jgi:predicted choloylglycine hydrolase
VGLHFKNKIDYRKGKGLTVEIYDIPYSKIELILIDYYELEGVRIIKIREAIVIASHKKDIILHSRLIETYCWIFKSSKTEFKLEINGKSYPKRPYKYNEILSNLLSSNQPQICTLIKVKNFDTQSFFINGIRDGKSIKKNRIKTY